MKMRTFAKIVLVILLFVGFFGMPLTFTGEHGSMGDCPYMQSHNSMCQKGVLSHISGWHAMFVGTIESVVALMLAVTFAVFALSITRLVHSKSPPGALHAQFLHHRRAEVKLFSPFIFIFSQGLLHPRVW